MRDLEYSGVSCHLLLTFRKVSCLFTSGIVWNVVVSLDIPRACIFQCCFALLRMRSSIKVLDRCSLSSHDDAINCLCCHPSVLWSTLASQGRAWGSALPQTTLRWHGACVQAMRFPISIRLWMSTSLSVQPSLSNYSSCGPWSLHIAAAFSSTDRETADVAHAATQRELKEVFLAQDDAFKH